MRSAARSTARPRIFCRGQAARAIWLTELDPEDPDIAFGLCDLGMGFPELGTVRISELEAIQGSAPGLRIEAEPEFIPAKTLSAYAEEAARAPAASSGEVRHETRMRERVFEFRRVA
jgi:hypothetical protein